MLAREQIAAVFGHSVARQREVQNLWMKNGFNIGSILPNSLLAFTVQDIGRLDCVLRTMEDEFSPSAPPEDPLALTVQASLSTAWIFMTYEVVRTLCDPKRNLVNDPTAIGLRGDLELVRIPLAKHEVPKDNKMKGPVQFTRNPLRNDPSDIVEYDPKSGTKAIIPPFSVEEATGSIAWVTYDPRSERQQIFERRTLSDRFISIDWEAIAADVRGRNSA